MGWTRKIWLPTIEFIGAFWPRLFMTVNYPLVGGSLLATVGVSIWRGLLWSSLRRKSLRCTIDKNTRFELRTSVWAYVLPLCGLSLGAFLGREALNAHSNVAFTIYLVFSVIFICGVLYLVREFATARVTVTEDRLVYRGEGKTLEIEASDVLGVKVLGYCDLSIHLRWDRRVTVPATFHRSELIFAFFRQAIIKNHQVDFAGRAGESR